MIRKLVTVRKISAIRPIHGADGIVVAVFDGWQCVVQKGQFAVNDRAVFFEIDSFLPAADERWAALEKSFVTLHGQLGFRVKSKKVRKQLSQGLLEPLHRFPEITSVLDEVEIAHETEVDQRMRDTSFQELLNVQKYEAPAIVAGNLFPSFIPQTDLERVQNLPDVLEECKDKVFQETTKMDGSSMTVYYLREDSAFTPVLPTTTPEPDTNAVESPDQPTRFGVCSRKVNLPRNSKNGMRFWAAVEKNDLHRKLERLGRSIAIQGELCGSSVQANLEGFPSGFHDFYVYSIWDIENQKHLLPKEVEDLSKELKLRHVPVHGYRRLGDMASTMEELLKRADGTGINGRKREGIVLKHADGGFSFKAISNSYLLKHGE